MARPLVEQPWWPPWRRWVWWRIRQARRRYRDLMMQQNAADPEEIGGFNHDLWLLHVQMEALKSEQLLKSAALCWIFVARQRDDIWKSSEGYRTLTHEFQHSLREQIWQRKIAVIGLLLAVSGVVQTVYAVLDFHLRR